MKRPQQADFERTISDPLANFDRTLRLECLRAANESAKAGVASDVFATAHRYLAWVNGEKVEDPNAGLDFIQRLDALVREFIREERSDPRKMIQEAADFFVHMEQQYPMPKLAFEEPIEEFVNRVNVDKYDPETDVIRMVHKEIQP